MENRWIISSGSLFCWWTRGDLSPDRGEENATILSATPCENVTCLSLIPLENVTCLSCRCHLFILLLRRGSIRELDSARPVGAGRRAFARRECLKMPWWKNTLVSTAVLTRYFLFHVVRQKKSPLFHDVLFHGILHGTAPYVHDFWRSPHGVTA